MRKLNKENLPHLIECGLINVKQFFSSVIAKIRLKWWRIDIGENCKFFGFPLFKRFPYSAIQIGSNCTFRSSQWSNYIGINHKCIIATLNENAQIKIGNYCGFSGTVVGANKKIIIGDYVRCGANTTITDTDWHSNDPRTDEDAPVIIEDNVWLGLNVTVLKGVTIGRNTLVATGSIVTNDLPANAIAGGIPAKVFKINNPIENQK
nr:acyltransferase [uncultured Desulfobacter sp.]